MFFNTSKGTPYKTYTVSNINSGIPEPVKAKDEHSPPPVVVYKFDWTALGFKSWDDQLAIVIDNAFSEEDCQKLISAAEESGPWEVAAVNGPGGIGYVNVSYRNSSRILFDTPELADWIMQKLLPYAPELETASSDRFNDILGSRGTKKVQLSKVNERLRFLKYGPGQFFKPHCDGAYFPPDESEISYYTIQIYLSGDAESLQGGATRFMTGGYKPKRFIDVPPRVGRVLIFEQDSLFHSGEEVISGEKIAVRTEFMYKPLV